MERLLMGVRMGTARESVADRLDREHRADWQRVRELVCEAREARHPRSVRAALEQIDRIAAKGLAR